MKQLIKYKIDEENIVYVEVLEADKQIDIEHGMQDVGAIRDKTGEVIDVVKGSFEKSLNTIYSFAGTITDKLKSLDPKKVEVEFGIKFSAEAGAIITSIGAEANLKITLTWENNK
jgi:hypothetical protein